ncbi:MAG: recombinase RecT, partial [Acidiferrobacterales bacterium]|nr:recombinase RecT [Acidiferrobacterales bacterium]
MTKQQQPQKEPTVLALLRQPSLQTQLEAATPAFARKYMSPDRIVRLAITEFRRTPGLARCTPQSVLSCLFQATQLGLSVDSNLQLAHLVPYRRKDKDSGRFYWECNFIPGYKGLMALSRRTGEVNDLYPEVVREGDVFTVSRGTSPDLKHEQKVEVPKFDSEGNLIVEERQAVAYYAVAFMKNGSKPFQWMSLVEIEKIRQISKAKNGPWINFYDSMAKKTVIRQLCKWLPSTVELDTAIA